MTVLISGDWQDYELLDSGQGRKLERFGSMLLDRPEAQATWLPKLPASTWQEAHASFQQERGWRLAQPLPRRWPLTYKELGFWVELSESRQVGVFPENATHWDWIREQIGRAGRDLHVLNLFGYTGLATLAAAEAGAKVTHVDASKRAVAWARENQALSGLADRPVRWIVDDALKYLGREQRRGVRYDGILMDPPAFGRGPGGEIWHFEKLFAVLCQACRAVLSQAPQFLVLTVYTKSASLPGLLDGIATVLDDFPGTWTQGKLATREQSAGRFISNALFVRWQASRS